MNVQKHARWFPSLAAGALLALGVVVVLVSAQEPGQDGAPVEPPALRAELLEYRLEHLAFPAGIEADELAAQGAGATADVRPPGSFDVALFGSDFEWAIPWTVDGLWHPVLVYLDIGHPYARNHSPICAMWYGQDGTGNYDTGARTTGSMTTTQPTAIPTSAVSVTVSFWSWEQTEQTGTDLPGSCLPPPLLCGYDRRELYISGTVTADWTLLWSTRDTPTVEGEWHQVVADISDYRGQAVRLRFTFDSGDASHNANEGWYVDDIAIVQHDVAVPGYPLTDAWAQSFYEDHPNPTPDEEVYLDRVGVAGVTTRQVTDDGDRQSYPAVAAHPVRGIPVVWTHYYTNTHGLPVGDVEYTVLNRDGTTAVPLTKVTDYSSFAFPSVEDYGPVVAANPADGSTVIAWTHCLSCPVSYWTQVHNVYYVIRDPSGGVVHGPVALTTNTAFEVHDYEPAVETFPNGNILLAWRHRDYGAPLLDVFYTVLDHQGATVKAIDNLSGRNMTVHGIHMARLADGNVLVAWSEDYRNIIYAVVDSSGTVVKAPTNLTSYAPMDDIGGWYPEALGLANGHSIVAWTHFGKDYTVAEIRYAVLGSTYNVVQPPAFLHNSYNALANGPVSMVADGTDAAILTWPAISYPYLHLYYARLDNTGAVLTAPTIYRQTRGSAIHTTTRGYGVGGLPAYQAYLPLVLRNYH
jgi:hypothetical protein